MLMDYITQRQVLLGLLIKTILTRLLLRPFINIKSMVGLIFNRLYKS